MGWNSWNTFGEEFDEKVIKQMADVMAGEGYLDCGYQYLILDDCWAETLRDEDGSLVPSREKFPDGIEPVIDYVHSKGLKFGIYSDAGSATCAGKFGSYNYETIDANQYAEWGVDLLKYDYCNAPGATETCKARYKAMGDALKASGRDILFYMCEWGVREPWKWGHETGATTWRCTYDTRDGWNGRGSGIGVVQSVNGMKDLWAYSGPNRYNDADMMCVGIHGTGKSSNDLVDGRPGMTQTEYRTQFSMWCMWASPLTLSFDLRQPITDDDLSIMCNEELIAINQDRMGQQAEFIGEDGDVQYYMKDLENGDVAIAVLNMGASSANAKVDFSRFSALVPGKEYIVRDLWQHAETGTYSTSFNVNVASHETKVYRLSLKENTPVGISSVTGDATVRVKGAHGNVQVDCKGTKGQTKRILVSDTTGRVVASARGTETSFSLPVKTGKGIYIVNIIHGGKSESVKISL